MKLLVVGSGGREHALAWKLASSPRVTEVIVAPGNPGMLEPKIKTANVLASDFVGLEKLVRSEALEFVVVGPDQALADGLVDYLESRGIPAFGPTKLAAQIESSKVFAKELMQKIGIPTARFAVFGEVEKAKDFLETTPWGDGWVVKADGLALGKGVVVAKDLAEALSAITDFFSGTMGEAGKKILLEERLEGPEVSAFSLCDGERAVSLGFACDYKRIGDGNMGPNTGGMGAYSPADWLPEGFSSLVQEKIVLPLLQEMKKNKMPFKGILFTGLMVTKSGPKVLEFNARFGDPETQAILPLLAEDLLPWLESARLGALAKLSSSGPQRKSLSAVHVVKAAAGYPGAVKKGDVITVAPFSDNTKLFYAGVAKSGENFVTNGGRVLGLTALADTRQEARKIAYENLAKIQFTGAQMRGDIGA